MILTTVSQNLAGWFLKKNIAKYLGKVACFESLNVIDLAWLGFQEPFNHYLKYTEVLSKKFFLNPLIQKR